MKTTARTLPILSMILMIVSSVAFAAGRPLRPHIPPSEVKPITQEDIRRGKIWYSCFATDYTLDHRGDYSLYSSTYSRSVSAAKASSLSNCRQWSDVPSDCVTTDACSGPFYRPGSDAPKVTPPATGTCYRNSMCSGESRHVLSRERCPANFKSFRLDYLDRTCQRL